MAENLLENARTAQNTYPVKSCYAWTDSTVSLHWIRSDVSKIKSKKAISWKYVPTRQNPTDIGSRELVQWTMLVKSTFT